MSSTSRSIISVLFILPSLKAGGAERVVSLIASHINKKQFKPTILVIGYKKDAVFSTKGIDVIYLNKTRVLKAIPDIYKTIKKRKPNIVMGSISHVNRVLAAISYFSPKTKFVGREASVGSIMSQFNTTPKKRINITRPFFRNYYKKLDAIICQSNDMANDFIDTYNVNSSKIYIINNPISQTSSLKKSLNSTHSIKKIITVGRLSKEKGHERLLKILSKVNFPFEYTIIGNGNEKSYLLELAKELNIYENIRHIEYTDRVDDYLSKSDLFIQGSFVEGFPNALLESCAVGTPAIAFNVPGGTKEIILNGINGYLVDTNEDFIKTIEKALFSDDWQSKDIRESVLEKFELVKIVTQYETLFTSITNTNSK